MSDGEGIDDVKSEANVDGDFHAAEPGARRDADEIRWTRGAEVPQTGVPALGEEQRRALADVGHELKSPLSVMLALCTRLEDGGRLEGQDAEDVARIRANAYTMLRRVQDLMLMARAGSSEQQLEAAVVDAAAIVRTCLDGFASVAELRRIELRAEVPAELCAVADDEKLLSVVSNLVANAIRHAPPGGVVRCTLRADGDRLVLEVADNGAGIPPEQRDEVFERYRSERGGNGTGLGLAIVREIARLHGGTATAGEAPEGGALFTVAMPLRPQRATAVRPVRSAGLAERQRALVEELRAELAG